MSVSRLVCGPRPCPTPRAKRRLRNTLWVCPWCAGVWVQRSISGPGDTIWIWELTKLDLKY